MSGTADNAWLHRSTASLATLAARSAGVESDEAAREAAYASSGSDSGEIEKGS
jgi:hypothetical protein